MSAKLPLSPGCGCCDSEVCFQVVGCFDGVSYRNVADAVVVVSGPLPGSSVVGQAVYDSGTQSSCIAVPSSGTFRATVSHPKFATATADFTATAPPATVYLTPASDGAGERVCVTCCPYPLSRSLHLETSVGGYTLTFDDATNLWGGGGLVTASPYYDVRKNPYTLQNEQWACGYVWDGDPTSPKYATTPQDVEFTWVFDGCSLGTIVKVAVPPATGSPYYGGPWALWPNNATVPVGWTVYDLGDGGTGAAPMSANCDPLVYEWNPAYTLPQPNGSSFLFCNQGSTANGYLLAAVFGGGDHWTLSEVS